MKQTCSLKDKQVGYLNIWSETVLHISYTTEDRDCTANTTDFAQYYSTKKIKLIKNSSEGIKESLGTN